MKQLFQLKWIDPLFPIVMVPTMSFSSKECVLQPSQLTRQSQDEALSTAKARSIAIRTRISMKLAQMYPFFQVRLYAKVIKPPMLWLCKGLVIDSSSNRFYRARLLRDKIDEVRKTDALWWMERGNYEEIRYLRDSESSCSNRRASLFSYDYTRDFSYIMCLWF